MGSFYGNVTLVGTTIEEVIEASPRPAYVFADNDAVVVLAEVDDDGAPTSGATLSEAVGCVAFSTGVHDDDIFLFEVHDRGRLVAAGAVPDPAAYFGLDVEMLADIDPDLREVAGTAASPSSGPVDLDAVVGALGRGDSRALRAALEADFVFASDRHQAVVDALGLPGGAVGWGFRSVAKDPAGYAGPALTPLT